MDSMAGTKRKAEATQVEARKRRTTEQRDVNELEADRGSDIDLDEEQGIRDAGGEETETLELSEDFVGDSNGFSEEDHSDKDIVDEHHDESDDLDWLQSIYISIKADDTADSPQIGSCVAALIDRDYIRATFHRDMGKLSNDTAIVGFGVFNRWGCLKPEFLTHPIKKGTGVWGPELNKGRFLLIETFSIQEKYQRMGYGRRLFEQLWEKAQTLAMQEDKDRRTARKERLEKTLKYTRTESEKPTVIDDEYLDGIDQISRPNEKTPSGCDFAILWAAVLDTGEVEVEMGKLLSPEKDLSYQRKQEAVEDFWRAMGFRRIGSSSFFCLARDPDHASRSLLSQDDYSRPAALHISARADDQDFPLMDPAYDPNAGEQQKKYNDTETKELLEARLRSIPGTDANWLSTDRHNNNLLHVLARTAKVESLAWALKLPFADTLRLARNLEGETPLEALQCQLESDRAWKQDMMVQVVMSDLFSGFTPSQVECFKLLEDSDPSPDEVKRLTLGCSCGECLGGFLSPRNLFALLCQAEIKHDVLNDELESIKIFGLDWCERHEEMFEHLAPKVMDNLRTNESLRQAFTSLFGHVAETLRAKRLPLTDAVLHYAESKFPPHVKNFLKEGGTFLAVVEVCFDCAINQDIYLGDGEHQRTFQEDIEALPACRNDGEFVFARRQCRRLESLPDELISEG